MGQGIRLSSYANKLIASAERINPLPESTPKPANEFQIRPCLKLEPELSLTPGPGQVKSGKNLNK